MQPEQNSIKIVAIGGGTGLSTLLSGLKPYLRSHRQHLNRADLPYAATEVDLTAIVTVTDDGKSSGRLRSEFDILPPGDIRNCLVALAKDDQLMKSLFRHRFTGRGSLGGHSLGNLILVALTQMTGNFLTAVEQATELLECDARILPSTLTSVDLEARVGNQTAYGQRAIKALSLEKGLPIQQLKVNPGDAAALPQAIAAIQAADIITLGPGSLFTSVLPNLLIEGIGAAVSQAKGKKIYLCNLMTEADETAGFTAEAHVDAILRVCPQLHLDYAVFNSAPISAEMRELYAEEEASVLLPPLRPDSTVGNVQFICRPLAAEARSVRHHPANLVRAIFEIYYNAQAESVSLSPAIAPVHP